MIESKENGLIANNDLNNVYGYYTFLTEDKYKEALEVFFSNGVSYKDKILLSSAFTAKSDIDIVKPIYLENVSYEIIFKATDKQQSEGIFYLGKDIGLSGEKIYIQVEYILDFAGGTTGEITDIQVDEDYIVLTSAEILDDRSFKIIFKMLDDFEEGTIFKLSSTPGYLWNLEQNKLQPAGDFRSIPPVMDSSDYISFLWSIVNNGWIIKQKIFDCKSLIDNRFESIKFLEKIYSNNSYIKYKDYKTLLENLEIGDILIFKQNSLYHCLIIKDPKTESYAECSGYLEQNLGTYFNGKLNPYPFGARFNFLKDNADVYLCRLYLSI